MPLMLAAFCTITGRLDLRWGRAANRGCKLCCSLSATRLAFSLRYVEYSAGSIPARRNALTAEKDRCHEREGAPRVRCGIVPR